MLAPLCRSAPRSGMDRFYLQGSPAYRGGPADRRLRDTTSALPAGYRGGGQLHATWTHRAVAGGDARPHGYPNTGEHYDGKLRRWAGSAEPMSFSARREGVVRRWRAAHRRVLSHNPRRYRDLMRPIVSLQARVAFLPAAASTGAGGFAAGGWPWVRGGCAGGGWPCPG